MVIQGFNAHAEYEHALRTAVVKVAGGDSAGQVVTPSLYYLIERAHGAYPVDVVATLTSLGLAYQEDNRAYRLGAATPAPAIFPDPRSLFADPHPADYDWRFNPATINALTKKLLLTVEGGRVALLGTKTVFAPLADRRIPVTLFNKSRAILDDLRAAGYLRGLVECDLSLPLASGHGSYQVVLADPPWYVDYYRVFLRRAAELLEVGGMAYVSVLPVLTRPGAMQDRTAIVEMATTVGLQLLSQQDGYLTYETPGFEQQALLAQGLCCRDWRRGDLWTFRRLATPTADPAEEAAIAEPVWVEYRVGTRRIKVKPTSPEEAGQFTYRATDPSGPVLTHVSRRSPLRSAIDVWSSANQAYTINRASLLHAALELLEANQRLPTVLTLLSAQHQFNLIEKLNLLALLEELTT